MSHLKAKSDFNIAASQLLIDDDYFAPSVHCSYYGLFQFINSKLNSLGKTYEKISDEIRDSKRNGNIPLNSHEYPIKLIVKEIEIKSDKIFAAVLKDKINLLKTYRKESDYLNILVDYNQGVESLRLSKEIISIIKSKL